MSAGLPVLARARFYALDGLRGLAAVAVMLYHYTQHNGMNWMPRAWLAVDVFFCLSGFVLAFRYAQPIQGGMSLMGFMGQRLRRLYPLYFLSCLIGVWSVYLFVSNGWSGLSGASGWGAVISSFFLLPYFGSATVPVPHTVLQGLAFPLNVPAWSLFIELLVNVGFFLWLRAQARWHWPQRRVVWLAAAGFLVWMLGALALGGADHINAGWSQADCLLGLPRAVVSFFLGVGLHELYRSGRIAPWLGQSQWAALALVLMGAMFVLPVFHGSNVLILLALLGLGPLLIVSLVHQQWNTPLNKCCAALGAISYPLYILHYSLYECLYALSLWHPVDTPVHTIGMAMFIVACLVVVAAYLDRRVLGAVHAASTSRP